MEIKSVLQEIEMQTPLLEDNDVLIGSICSWCKSCGLENT